MRLLSLRSRESSATTVVEAAPKRNLAPTATPIAAAAHRLAVAVSPRMSVPWWMIASTPVATIRVGSNCMPLPPLSSAASVNDANS